jgi:hypothetical protein
MTREREDSSRGIMQEASRGNMQEAQKEHARGKQREQAGKGPCSRKETESS